MSKSTQNKVALYLAAMLLLNCFLLVRTRSLIAEGLPDFTIFYTAARIVDSGEGSRLYDDQLQEQVQASFSPRGTKLRRSLLPYNHPPFEALLFLPLARVPYFDAYLIWFAINAALICVLPFLLRSHLRSLQQFPPWIWILAGFSFFPIFAALIKGQDSIMLLFLYSLGFAAFCRDRQGAVGLWTALGLFKYNLVVPFALSFGWRKRYAVVFAAITLLLILLSVSVTGWAGLLDYPKFVWSAEHNPHFAWNDSDGNTPNLRGVISTILPLGETAKQILIGAASLMVLVLAVRATRNARLNVPVGFAIALTAAGLVSYHVFVHDLSLLYLPMLIALNEVASNAQPLDTPRKTLIVCSLILFCSPVYMILSLRYGQLQLLTWVILIFFFTLLKLPPSPSEAPQPA